MIKLNTIMEKKSALELIALFNESMKLSQIGVIIESIDFNKLISFVEWIKEKEGYFEMMEILEKEGFPTNKAKELYDEERFNTFYDVCNILQKVKHISRGVKLQ